MSRFGRSGTRHSRRAAAPVAILLASALAGCASSGTGSQTKESPSATPSVSGSAGAGGADTYPTLAALEAALAAHQLPCTHPQAASTSGIRGAVASVACRGWRGSKADGPANVRLVLFDSHADAVVWQNAMVAGRWEADYVVGGNWGIAGPAAVYGLWVTSALGGKGLSPTATPGISSDAVPP